MKVNSITLESNKKLNFKGLNAQKVVNNVISTEAPKFQKTLIPLTAVPVLAATVINSKQNKQNQEIQSQDSSQETLSEKFIPNFAEENENFDSKPAERKMPFVEKPVVAEVYSPESVAAVKLRYERLIGKYLSSTERDMLKEAYNDFMRSCDGSSYSNNAMKALVKLMDVIDREHYYDTTTAFKPVFEGLKRQMDDAIQNSKLGEFLDKAKEKLTPENITAFFQIMGYIKGLFILAKSLINNDKEMEVKGVVCILDNAVFPIKSAILGIAGDMFESLGIKAGSLAGPEGTVLGGLAGRITGVATANKIWEKNRDVIVQKIYEAITGGGDDGGSKALIADAKDDMSDLKYIDESKSKLRADNIDFGDAKGYKISVGELKDIVFKELFSESLFTLEELEQMRQQINKSEGSFQVSVNNSLFKESEQKKAYDAFIEMGRQQAMLHATQTQTQTQKQTQKESIFSKLKDKVSDAISDWAKNTDTTSFWDKLKGKEKQKY